MVGSTFTPTTWRDVDTTKARPATLGFQGSCAANQTQSADFLITDDSIVRGISFIAKGVTFGDKVTISVIDKDAVYAPANTVLAIPVKDLNCLADQQSQANYEAVAPQKILGGVYVRVTYTNNGLLSVVNYGVNLIILQVLI